MIGAKRGGIRRCRGRELEILIEWAEGAGEEGWMCKYNGLEVHKDGTGDVVEGGTRSECRKRNKRRLEAQEEGLKVQVEEVGGATTPTSTLGHQWE